MTTDLQEYLEYYCALEEPEYAVLVTGEWGCGKTYQVKQCLSESHSYYVSLFGLATTDAVHDAALAEMAPLITGARKFLPSVSGGIGAAFGMSSISKIAPGIINSILRRKVRPDKVLVFDDLERCTVNIRDLSGVINTYVEHHKCRVVVIAHDQRILGCFRSMKEKLIGQTIEVTPNVLDAFEVFSSKYICKELQELFSRHQNDIIGTFRESETQSLRMLRHIIEDLRRLYQCLSPKQKKHHTAVGEIVRLHCAVNLEHRIGNLKENDLKGRANQLTNYVVRSAVQNEGSKQKPSIVTSNEKYSSTDLESNILNDEVLTQTLVRGTYSEAEIQRSVGNSAHFLEPEEEETPAWKVVMNLDELDEPIVEMAIQRMKGDFDKREIKSPGEMLHVFALMLMLSERKVIKENVEEVERSCEKYIDDLLADDDLSPLELRTEKTQRLEDNYGGFTYWVLNSYKDVFERLKDHLQEARGTARDRILQVEADDLLEILRKDSQQFAEKVSYTGGTAGRFAADSLLQNIEPVKFVDAWLANPPSKWRVVRYALENRYVPGSKLTKEYQWLQEVLDVVKGRVENTEGIRSLQISRIVPNVPVLVSESEEEAS